jgi:hypothetical protein
MSGMFGSGRSVSLDTVSNRELHSWTPARASPDRNPIPILTERNGSGASRVQMPVLLPYRFFVLGVIAGVELGKLIERTKKLVLLVRDGAVKRHNFHQMFRQWAKFVRAVVPS